MRRSGLLLSWKFVIGIFVCLTLLIPHIEALRGSAVVLQAKARVAEQKLESDDEANGTSSANSTKSLLTGIPQIDYILDPNLPRELNGHNLTDYPFYNAIPDDIDFKCDGLHDGFYASVPHKCQVYHHCLFGTRYDFLCANYTAFDQKTFICHFVSEVDCVNSPKYYKRNEALYKEATTTTTTTSTTVSTPTTTVNNALLSGGNGGGSRYIPVRRRRPYRRRRPMYEYYYDDDEYADSDYYDDEVASLSHRRTQYNRKPSKDTYGNENHDSETDYDLHTEQIKPAVRSSNVGSSIYDRARAPPKIRRPVPKSERSKYDYSKSSVTSSTTTTTEKISSSASKKQPTASTDDEYYEDDEEYDYEEPRAKTKHHIDYDFPAGYEETRRYANRYRSRMPPVRKRTEFMYDDYDLKERPRMNRRKEYTGNRYDNERLRNIRPIYRNKNRQDEEYKYIQSTPKKRVIDGDYRSTARRPESKRLPTYDDDYYYDEEEQEEIPPKRRRPVKEYNKTSKTNVKLINEKEIELTTLKQHKLVTTSPRNGKSNTLENDLSKEQTHYNEISTTENIINNVSNEQKYSSNAKTVKLINNTPKEETLRDHSITEEYDETIPPRTRLTENSSQFKYNNVIKSVNTAQNQQKSLPAYLELELAASRDINDDKPNKTITPIRHFVITMPRKTSHFSSLNPLPASTEKSQQKLPDQKLVTNYNDKITQYTKISSSPKNVSYSEAINLANYLLPIHSESPHQHSSWSQVPSDNTKPVQEDYSPENLNAIANSIGINYNNGYISEPKPFTNEASKSPSNYRQENRLYTTGERLYTNSISFPHHQSTSYDIAASGSSTPEESMIPDKKYSDIRTYTTNVDYDVTYNDALQPSTLHPVRRHSSTTFFMQNQPHRVPQRMSVESFFNEGNLNVRPQRRYNK